MPTVKVNLSQTQYVQVNTGFDPILLQAHRDSVRVALSEAQPALSNEVFHVLGREDPVMQLLSLDTNVWALATSDTCSLVASETGPLHVTSGRGDLTTDVVGNQKVVQDYSMFRGLFTFDVNPLIWIVEEDGVEVFSLASTRATSVNGYLNVTSGATPGNKAQVESRRHFRYQPLRGMKWGTSLGFKGASSDGILRAGLFVDFKNGAYFKTKGDYLVFVLTQSTSTDVDLTVEWGDSV